MTPAATASLPRRALALAGALALAAGLAWPVVRLLLPAGSPGGVTSEERQARAAARAFLDRYVAPGGRVLRRDQGGDSVSEGVSYGLLLAEVANDRRRAGRIWDWAREHMQRDDGLLAWLVGADGRVADREPASDGDLVSAWALGRGGSHAEGARLADAVLARETVAAGGAPVLAAGPWATGEPATVNPSYWALPAFGALRRQTGDRRWHGLARSSLRLTRELTAGGRRLPADWARIDGATISASGAPSGEVPVRYGPDAQRLVVWMAAGCGPAARALAARWWRMLRRPGRAGALALSPDGEVLDGRRSPLALVASAAAAGAAGAPDRRERLLDEAGRVSAAHPSYYGDAWVALGRSLLTTDLLGGCAAR